MYRILGLAALVTALSCLVSAQSTARETSQAGSDTGRAEQEVRKLEEELRAASLRGDAAFFERILADDYTSVGPSGEVETRPEIVAAYKAGALKYEALDADEVNVRTHGDAAVVTERDTMKGYVKNHYFSGRYRLLRVWARQQGRWRLVASQSTFVIEKEEDEEAAARTRVGPPRTK
jgi:uncharacterized protein (TIGR02246 family)